MGGTIEYFRDTVFNYPTLAEAYKVAALDGRISYKTQKHAAVRSAFPEFNSYFTMRPFPVAANDEFDEPVDCLVRRLWIESVAYAGPDWFAVRARSQHTNWSQS